MSNANRLPISVVVCVRNRAALLAECLPAIAANDPAEIIVVDGDSTDGTPDVARRWTSAVYSDERRGLAYARQLGAERATQPYVAFVDSDVLVPANTLRQMLDELQSWNFAALHAQVIGADVRNYWEWAQDKHFQLTFNRPGARKAIGMIAALVRRDVLLKHPFDAYFVGASEDGDLSVRIRQGGYMLGVSTAHVYHRHRSNFRSFVTQRVWYGEGTARMAWKQRSLATLLGPLAFPLYGTVLAWRARQPALSGYFLANGVLYAVGMSKALVRALLPMVYAVGKRA